MKNLKKIILGLCILVGVYTPISAQNKIKINKADELPRRSVTFKGKAKEILNDRNQLQTLNETLIKNLEADLEKYEIADKATLKGYYQALVRSYVFKKDFDKALLLIEKVRELEEKAAEKLTTGIYLKSYIKARKSSQDTKSDVFKNEFRKEYANIWNALPYNEVKNELESMRGSFSIFNPDLITASLDSQIQPFLDKNKNVVPEGLIGSFISMRMSLDERADLVPVMLSVLNDIFEKNKNSTPKKDIWADRDVDLFDTDKGMPVVIAVWDSGVDMNVFSEKLRFKDKSGKSGLGYSLIDFKKDGLLLENPKGKIKTDIKRLQTLTKGFMDLQAGIESPEVGEVRKAIATLKPEQVKDFQEELSFYGNYAHGTHVAGIAMKGNPFARLLAVRMAFEYRSLPPAHKIPQRKQSTCSKYELEVWRCSLRRYAGYQWYRKK